MNKEKIFFKQTEKEYLELNNKIVIPAYRKFCEELELTFHFWNELPEDSFDPETYQAEIQLHNKAMKLFNILKPEFTLFKDSILWFQFTGSDGTFTYDLWSIHDFFEEVSNDIFYLKKLKKRFNNISSILVIVSSFFIFIATVFLIEKLSPWDFLRDVSIWLGIGIGSILYYLLMHHIKKNIPRKIIDDGRFEGIVERVNELREQLAQVKGSRPDPLNKKKLSRMNLKDKQQSINITEIDQIVRRIKKRLSIISDDKNK